MTWVFLNMVLLRFSCCHSLPLLFWCIVCFLYVPKDSSRALSSLSFDIPGWGACFHGLVGDGSVSVSIASPLRFYGYYCLQSEQELILLYDVGYGGCVIVHNPKQETRGGEANGLE